MGMLLLPIAKENKINPSMRNFWARVP